MVNFYNFLKESDPSQYKVDHAGTVTAGDMLQWDGSLLLAKRVTASTDGHLFAGVSMGAVPISSNIDKVPGLDNSVLIKSTGVFSFQTTPTESYKHGLPVVVGADAQTIRLAVIGGMTPDAVVDYVGYVWLPLGETVTGAAGLRVNIKIQANYPPISA